MSTVIDIGSAMKPKGTPFAHSELKRVIERNYTGVSDLSLATLALLLQPETRSDEYISVLPKKSIASEVFIEKLDKAINKETLLFRTDTNLLSLWKKGVVFFISKLPGDFTNASIIFVAHKAKAFKDAAVKKRSVSSLVRLSGAFLFNDDVSDLEITLLSQSLNAIIDTYMHAESSDFMLDWQACPPAKILNGYFTDIGASELTSLLSRLNAQKLGLINFDSEWVDIIDLDVRNVLRTFPELVEKYNVRARPFIIAVRNFEEARIDCKRALSLLSKPLELFNGKTIMLFSSGGNNSVLARRLRNIIESEDYWKYQKKSKDAFSLLAPLLVNETLVA